jgi:hypothetical protein
MAKIFDSAIEYKTNNSRAVSVQDCNSFNKAFKVDREGNLWSAFFVTPTNINVYYSTDNGFTWNWVSNIQVAPIRGTEPYGDVCHLMVSKAANKLVIFTNNGYIFELPLDDLKLNPSINVSRKEMTITVMNIVVEYVESTKEYITDKEAFDLGVYSVCGDADSDMYVTFSKNGLLKCSSYSIPNSNREAVLTSSDLGYDDIWPVWEAQSDIECSEKIDCVSKGRYIYIAYIDPNERLMFTMLDKQTRTFFNTKLIDEANYKGVDPTVSVDGLGTILVTYGSISGNASDVSIFYKFSNNNGTSFSSLRSIGKPLGATVYIDQTTSRPSLKLSAIGDSASKFIIGAIFTHQGNPSVFVKEISSVGAQTDWLKANTKSPATGLQFFTPFNDRLAYFGDKKGIRFAYQYGFGDTLSGNDTIVTSVYQETLGSLAYAVTDTTSLSIDPISSGNLRVDFRVVGSLADNVDYYVTNVVGEYTDSYLAAFNKIGTSVKIEKYEPIVVATDTGRSAYNAPVVYTEKILIDPKTYDFPAVARESAVVTQYIERDIRKAFFKPDFFMNRNYILNDGGYIKRTVWVLFYLGNTYEISQIVPRFIDNQICFYEANVYVIGPSNDPFRKLTLPSET